MAASGRRKTPTKVEFPTFDPAPSGRLAARALRGAKVHGALIGRLAIWAWVPNPSEHAFTKDLDIAVTKQDLPKLRAWLCEEELPIRELPIGGINVKEPGGKTNVDFICRLGELGDLSELFEAAVTEAIAAKRTATIGGKELALVSAEYLVAMKLGTGESDAERDAERVLSNVKVNVDKLRKLVARYLGAMGTGRLEELFRRVGHPAARPKGPYKS